MEFSSDVDRPYLKQSLKFIFDCTLGHVAVCAHYSLRLIRNDGEQVQREHPMAFPKVSVQEGFLQVQLKEEVL